MKKKYPLNTCAETSPSHSNEPFERPLVTLVLIAFNQEKYIVNAIKGALEQTYSPLEIVISDDCSSDRTHELMLDSIADYTGPHKVDVIQNKTNRGLAANLNSALAKAKGEIITWTHGDDIILPERTQTLVSAILREDGVVAAHSSLSEMDEEGNFLRVREHSDLVRRLQMCDVIENGISAVTQSLAFRREIHDHFGPFQDELKNEGKAMAFRIAAFGAIRYVDVDKPLTKYRMGSGISTYSGRDIVRLKIHEPIKVTEWYLSAYKQMLVDCQHLDDMPQDKHLKLRAKIYKQIRFYENLYEINSGSGLVGPLFRNFIAKPSDPRSLRAVLRRIIPTSLYRRGKFFS
jgi:glycosyltransferase involved in cell wall biosynthesis